MDKSFETLQAEEKQKEQQNLVGVKQPLNHVEHECVPFSIRAYKNLENNEQVDLQRKVMEDPLMLIKQREMESRRKILENPVKLKELHRILKTDEKLRKVSKKSKKPKKSKKSKKKHKKNKSGSSFGSNSDTDLDSKLAKKLKGGLLIKDEVSSMGLNLNKLLDSKFEKISQELDKAAGKNKKSFKKNRSKSDRTEANSSSDEEQNYRYRRSSSLSKNRKFYHKDRNDRSRSVSNEREIRFNKYGHSQSRSLVARQLPEGRQERSFKSRSRDRKEKTLDYHNRRSRSFSTNKETTNRSRSRSRGTNIRNRRDSKSPKKDYRNTKRFNVRSPSKSRERKRSYTSVSESSLQARQNSVDHSTSTSKRSSKMTNEEKQAKLKEMMSNAAWREEERSEVVRKHREASDKEEVCHATQEFDKGFLNKEVKKAMANQTSVGSRLRANLNNIQRTSAAMNKNFARK